MQVEKEEKDEKYRAKLFNKETENNINVPKQGISWVINNIPAKPQNIHTIYLFIHLFMNLFI